MEKVLYNFGTRIKRISMPRLGTQNPDSAEVSIFNGDAR